MTKLLTAISMVLAATAANAQGVFQVSLYDTTFQVVSSTGTVATPKPTAFELRWGSFASGIFTPFYGSVFTADNTGYFGFLFSTRELTATLAAPDNAVIARNSQFALAVTLLPNDGAYTVTQNEVVLTDPSWIVPQFNAFSEDSFDVNFTSNTTALKGGYSFNGGNEILTLASASTVIPEPSSFAALAGLGMLGFAASRRRRAV